MALRTEDIPDSGAMVKAIPATHAQGVLLTHTDVVLRDVGGEKLKTLGVFYAFVKL
jgi:hypothetical protein